MASSQAADSDGKVGSSMKKRSTGSHGGEIGTTSGVCELVPSRSTIMMLPSAEMARYRFAKRV